MHSFAIPLFLIAAGCGPSNEAPFSPFDADGDGVTNSDETLCGADPNDAASTPGPTLLFGSGSSTDPYRLCDPQHVQLIGTEPYSPAATYAVVQDLDFAGLADIPQIGGPDEAFEGTLNGNSYAFRNVPVSGGADAGLFYLIGQQGVVHDLHIENATGTLGFVAGVLAAENEGLLDNVHIDATLNTLNHAGLLVGRNAGEINGCTSTGSIDGANIIGGLAGINTGSVYQSSSHATVSGGKRVGGLVGMTTGTIRESYAIGSVRGTTYVGGLVGTVFATGIIEDNYSLAQSVYAASVSGAVGGLLGTVESDTEWNGVGTRGTTTSTVPTLIARNYVSTVVTGGAAQEGLIGELSGELAQISESFWNRDLTASGTAGTGITDAELRDQTTYGAWDFATPIWILDPSIAAYPYLAWQQQRGLE